MTFTSLEFGIFLNVVFVLYWFVFDKKTKEQNILILIASYVFYGWWDWRFLILIFISSMTDYIIGQFLEKTEQTSKRKWLLYTSIFVNLGILFTFKYFGFFVDSFKAIFNISNHPSFLTLDLILPVGISFYTLQTLSYTIDVYDKKLKASHDFVSFFAYVSFFPQLVAGPIERATNLLPQFTKERSFSYEKANDGMRQILWGLFKKMVVADHCGAYADDIIANWDVHSGSTLLVGLIVATFRFYCDFSGYSDIAIGTGRLFGFKLSKNFDFPFFSRNVSEFWNKWHITLIEWFRFYIVNKLKGYTKIKITRNIFVVFLITGLWHGAAWKYIVWGLLHAVTFLPMIYGKRKKIRHTVAKGKLLPSLTELYQMTKTYMIFTLVGTFFVADTVVSGGGILQKVFSLSIFSMPSLPNRYVFIGITSLLIVEWLQREKEHGLEIKSDAISLPLRWGIYFFLFLFILIFGANVNPFTYFQF